jgi:hypothetical protein
MLYAAIQPSNKVRQAAACSLRAGSACTCLQLTLSRAGVRALVSSAVFFASAMLKIDFNLTRGASNLLLQLPHSRTMETEADTVGMHLLAKVPAFPHFMPPPPPLLLLLLKLFGRLLQACIDPSAMVRVFQTFQQHAKSETLLGQCVTRHTHATRYETHSTRHTSHATRYTSHATRYTSHATRYETHSTRHTSHATRYESHIEEHAARNTILNSMH